MGHDEASKQPPNPDGRSADPTPSGQKAGAETAVSSLEIRPMRAILPEQEPGTSDVDGLPYHDFGSRVLRLICADESGGY